MTIYQSTPPPWATGTKRIQSFASGLIRVDQDYKVPTATAYTDGAALVRGAVLADTTSPAVDGLYIYPDPSWSDDGDGFTTIPVSAYGRTQTTAQAVILEQEATSYSSYRFNVWKISGTICLSSNEALSLDDLNLSESLFVPFNISNTKNPDESVLSISETGVSFSTYGSRFPDNTGIIHGSYKVEVSTLRTFKVEMTTNGKDISSVVTIKIRDPSHKITSTRSFGKFVEYDFETSRGNTTATIV